MAVLITIAGPQSSGKTTVCQMVKLKHPEWNYLEETNPYTLTDGNHPGAAFTTKKLELQIVNEDIRKIKKINRLSDINLIETGIMHLMYLEAMINKKTADRYFDSYLKAHEGLKTIIIFIDTKPEISWLRRKNKYKTRVEGFDCPSDKKKALQKYKDAIFRFYPLWIKWLDRIPFEKYVISNSQSSYAEFQRKILDAVSKVHTLHVSQSTLSSFQAAIALDKGSMDIKKRRS